MISIELDDENRIEIQRIFQGHSDQSIDDIAMVVAQLAFDEWMGWLSGAIRYTSVTNQDIERIACLYTHLAPDKEPDINFLYNRCSIPYGRARYITQVLLERQIRELNIRAQKQLLEELEKAKEYVEEKGYGIPKVEIRINRRSGRVLMNAVQEIIVGEKKDISLTEIRSPLPDIRIYTLSPGNVELVLEKVKSLRL